MTVNMSNKSCQILCGALIMVGVIGLAVAPAKKEFDGKSLGDDM